jgi:hypothetical protein
MRIRILQKPDTASIDGIRLDCFEPGFRYDVGPLLGALLLAEGWAEPVADDEPAPIVPVHQVGLMFGGKRLERRQAEPSGRRRHDWVAQAADRSRRRR